MNEVEDKKDKPNLTLAEALVENAKIQQQTEKMRLDHPGMGKYDKDGRLMVLESDYNVNASSHKALIAYLNLAEKEFDEGTNLFVCLSAILIFIPGTFAALTTFNFKYGVIVFLITIALFILVFFVYRNYYYSKKLNLIVDYLLKNNIRIEDFLVIADKHLPQKAVLRGYLLGVQRIYFRREKIDF